MERQEFEAYVNSRDLPGEFPGTRGFGLVERVQQENLASYLETVRADGAPDFALRQGPDFTEAWQVERLASAIRLAASEQRWVALGEI